MLARAEQRVADEQFEAAEAACSEILKSAPFHALAYSLRARARLEKPRPDRAGALSDAERGVALEPNGLAFSTLGWVQLNVGRNEDAIDNLSRALALNSSDGLSYAYRALARLILFDIAGAQADIEKALAHGDVRAKYMALVTRGDALMLIEHNIPEALSQYEQAIALAPTQPQPYIGRAKARLASYPRDVAGALADTQKALELRPSSPAAMTAYGSSLAESGDRAGAMREWSRAIEIDPEHLPALAARANAQIYAGNLDAAQTDIDHAMRFNPRWPEILLVRSRLRVTRGENQAAVVDLDRAIEQLPTIPALWAERALIKASLPLPDWRSALADAERAIALGGNDAAHYGTRAQARSGVGDMAGAAADIDRALARNPRLTLAYEVQAGLKAAAKDYRGAVEALNKVLSLYPASDRYSVARVLANRGIYKAAIGDTVGAMVDYNRTIEIRPEFAEAYYNRGHLHSEMGDDAAAIADYSRCIERKKNFPHPYVNRGGLYLKAQDADKALADFDAALAIEPTLAPARHGRSQALIALGQNERAMLEYDALLAATPTPALHASRGRLRLQIGDFAGAYRDFEAARLHPDAYTRFFHAVAARRSGMPLSDAPLRDVIAKQPEGWTKTVARFLVGDLSEEDFLQRAEQGGPAELAGHRCEANYYIGEKRLVAGNKAEAIEFFSRAVHAGASNFTEHQIAKAELKRLTN